MINYVGMQPSEVDKLSVYEMRSFIQLAIEEKKRDKEGESSKFGAIAKLFSLGGKRK